MILELTAIIFLNSGNQFVFVMGKHCVFFEVRTLFLNTIYINFGLRRIYTIVNDAWKTAKYTLVGYPHSIGTRVSTLVPFKFFLMYTHSIDIKENDFFSSLFRCEGFQTRL